MEGELVMKEGTVYMPKPAEEFHPLPYYNHGRLVQMDPRLSV